MMMRNVWSDVFLLSNNCHPIAHFLAGDFLGAFFLDDFGFAVFLDAFFAGLGLIVLGLLAFFSFFGLDEAPDAADMVFFTFFTLFLAGDAFLADPAFFGLAAFAFLGDLLLDLFGAAFFAGVVVAGAMVE